MLQLTFTSSTGPTGKFVKVTKTITLTAETKRQVYYYNESKNDSLQECDNGKNLRRKRKSLWQQKYLVHSQAML